MRCNVKVQGVSIALPDGENFPFSIGVFLGHADETSGWCCDVDAACVVENHLRINDFHFLWHFAVKAEESIAMGGEHLVGDFFIIR